MSPRRLSLPAVAVMFVMFPALLLVVNASADEPEDQVFSMLSQFEPAIDAAAARGPWLIAVGPFFSASNQKREKIGAEVEAAVFDQVFERFSLVEGVTIVDWKRAQPLRRLAPADSGEVGYHMADWAGNLEDGPERGFLITGFAHFGPGGLRLQADLVEVPEGTVLQRYGQVPVVENVAAQATELVRTAPTMEAPAAKSTHGKPPLAAAPLGTLFLDVTPEDARVRLAGEERTFQQGMTMPPGVYTFEASAPGFEPKQFAVTVAAGEQTRREVRLSPVKAEIVLKATVVEGKNFRYEGQVNEQGQKHGHGALIFDSGDRYDGQWQQDRMHGEGTYVFSDGDKYTGQWQNNRMHGKGTYIYTTGDRYVGEFRNDVKDGPGTYFFKNGDRWEGSYLDGKKHGTAVYTWTNGQTQQELWEQGVKVK